MAFWSKKTNGKALNSEEYELISKKIVTFSTNLDQISVKLDALDTQFRSLRGKINSFISENPPENETGYQYSKQKDPKVSPFLAPWERS